MVNFRPHEKTQLTLNASLVGHLVRYEAATHGSMSLGIGISFELWAVGGTKPFRGTARAG
jgi:hypothetical protein